MELSGYRRCLRTSMYSIISTAFRHKRVNKRIKIPHVAPLNYTWATKEVQERNNKTFQ